MEKKSVFISYSSKDTQEVGEVLRILEQEEIPYWKAPEMIPIGSNYAKEIPRFISDCEIFLLIISKASQNSIWVEKEIDFAINNRKTIVPLKITSEPLTDAFRFYLNNVQTICYGESRKKALDMLKIRLHRLLGDNVVNQTLSEPKYEEIVREEKVKRNRRISDTTFGLNPQPVSCKYCNGKLRKIIYGIYQCVNCGKENYDYFYTVRNYLEKAGPSSRMAIEKATGVPRASIDYFLQQGKLEIPEVNNVRMACKRCGVPIRMGEYCDRCK